MIKPPLSKILDINKKEIIILKRILSCLLCFVFIGSTVISCSKDPADTSASYTTASETAASTDTSPSVTEDTSAESSASESSEEAKWFTFNPKVSSSFMLDIYGKDKCDAWSSLVDAVMEGKDTFECVDKHTYIWTIKDFPDRYFPVLNEIIKTPDDYLDLEIKGTAPIEYKVSKDKAAQMIAEFTKLVEDIINETIKPEYNDFEKALALYNYFASTYVYDYDTATLVESEPSKVNYTSSYRLLTTKTGICCELSKAYSYLLMQVGVEATTVIGGNHEWSFIKLGDNYYHIDPTWVIDDWYSLKYFLMTDKQRQDQGRYKKKDYEYVGEYSPEKAPDYSAKDDSFSSMWECHVSSFDPDTKTLVYTKFDADGNEVSGTFDYSAYCN